MSETDNYLCTQPTLFSTTSAVSSHGLQLQFVQTLNPLALELSAQWTLQKTCNLNGHHYFARFWQ
jgi:hypothetical protein